MFQWLNRDKPAPEQLELDGKLQQLEVLEERYAEAQTEYVTLQNGLAAFKLRYWRRVGDLYAQLDALRAEAARLRARLAPRDPLRQAAVKAAATQARASADAAREMDVDLGGEDFSPTEDLRKFYRMAAKIVHPDRAGDEDDRDLRDEIMSRVNVAYRDGHVHTIQALIDEYQMRAQPGHDDAATRLIRTIRLMSRVREQIGEITQATAMLRESGLHRLFKTVEEAEARGEDKLRVIEIGVERDIARAEIELVRLHKQLNELSFSGTEVSDVPAPQAASDGPVQAGVPEMADDTELAEMVSEAPSRGRVSSQAELAIAGLLDELGLACAYLQPLAGSDYTPAFTLLDRDDQTLLWEHQAHTEDEEARVDWLARQVWYAANGFDTGVNLFVTRDEPDGSFKLERLRKVAEYIRSQC